MARSGSRSRLVPIAAVAALLCGCAVEHDEVQALRLSVCDVGQGLAQIVHRGGQGIACDIGTEESASLWRAAYREDDSPVLNALVVSHTDADHVGGLAGLDTAVGFSGLVYVSTVEDTGRVLQQSGPWAPRLRFRRVAAGDTIGGVPGVLLEVLWPPAVGAAAQTSPDRNRWSLVVRVSYGGCAAMLTGDIDTVALHALSSSHGSALACGVLVAPHHGSATGVDRVFYGFTRPDLVVVSCGEDNPYGHPSPLLIDLAFEMGITVHQTWREGGLRLQTQGYYWYNH